MDKTFSNKPTMNARAEVIKLIRRLELTDYEKNSLSKLVPSSLIENEREKEERRNSVLYCKELDKYFKSQREAARFFGCTPQRMSQCVRAKVVTVKVKYTLETL